MLLDYNLHHKTSLVFTRGGLLLSSDFLSEQQECL